jgi:thiamine-phosphate pyrophosphorylase
LEFPLLLVSRLHLVTDTRAARDPLPEVAGALRAGVDWVQVRAKGCSDRELFDLTVRVLEQARAYDATVVVDDRADVALAAGAHGVHLGAEDLPVAEVRRILGPGRLVGATAREPVAARAAVAAGADYLGVGPAFGTVTKTGLPDPIGVEGVAQTANAVDVPVVAIGGVDRERLPGLLAAGVHGAAVVSAVSQAADPAAAAAALLETIRRATPVTSAHAAGGD